MGKLLHTLKHSLLGGAAPVSGKAPALQVRVRCSRCGETIATRVDKATEMLCEFGDVPEDATEPPHPVGYTLHKEFLGRKCQNLIQLHMHFDDRRRLTSHEVEGGELEDWSETN